MSGGRHFLFTMTAGRTGTAFLAELLRQNLPDVESHHELIGWERFGVDTPDVSHMTLFNARGNVPKVQAFWAQKLGRIRQGTASVYAESSHLLMKAGLIENLGHLKDAGTVHLVALERDPFETILSYRNRFDFMNKGMWWMWYLDPDYPRNILRAPGLIQVGLNGLCLWYILEIRSRAAFYRHALAQAPFVRLHRVDLKTLSDAAGAAGFLAELGIAATPAQVSLPPPQNRGQRRINWGAEEEERIRQLIATCDIDPEDVAARAWERAREARG